MAEEIPNEPVCRDVESTAEKANEEYDLTGVGSGDVLA